MRTLLALTVSALFIGCTPKPTDVFLFDCVVFDQKVNAPVGQASVILKVQRASGGFNPNYETVASATTDSNGRFSMEIGKEVFYSFRFEVSHPRHFSRVFDISPDDVPISTAYSGTFDLEPKGWVSVHLINQNGSQQVSVIVNADSENCPDCCGSAATVITGFPVDSTLTCQVYGGQQVSVSGNYTDINGSVHAISGSALVAAFDTAHIEVIY